MFTRNDFFSGANLIVARISLLFVVSFLTSFDTSASTLTITDDNGEKAPLEIQSGDYVRVTTASDGDDAVGRERIQVPMTSPSVHLLAQINA